MRVQMRRLSVRVKRRRMVMYAGERTPSVDLADMVVMRRVVMQIWEQAERSWVTRMMM